MIPRTPFHPDDILVVWKGKVANPDALSDWAVEAHSPKDTVEKGRYLERIDRTLAAGRMPAEVPELDNRPTRRVGLRRFISDAVYFGGMAAAVGFLVGNAVGHGGIGAVVGLGLEALRRTRTYTGVATTELEGQTFRHRWMTWPHLFARTPAEIRHLLIAKNVLGDNVGPASASLGALDPSRDAALTPHLDRLRALGAERRLVASFGQTSRYGKAAVNVVDAATARGILAASRSSESRLYVVSVQDVRASAHTYSVDSRSLNRTSAHVKNRSDYTTTTVDYDLRPILEASDLDTVPSGRGVPPGLLGLYRDGGSFSQVVQRDNRSEMRMDETLTPLEGNLGLREDRNRHERDERERMTAV